MSMNTEPDALEAILAKLAKDVEIAVHTLYRRQAGPDTTQVRTERFVREARDKIAGVASATGVTPTGSYPRVTPSVASPAQAAGGSVSWSPDETAAVTKCVLAWLPMGSPSSATPDSRCIAPGRELIPLWGEREMARQAVKRIGAG